MKIRRVFVAGLALVLGASFVFPATHHISAQDGDFGLQVSPSPLVTTLKPGSMTELELKIRNSGSQSEDLKIETRSFKIVDEEIILNDGTPPEINDWVSFAEPKFTVKRNEEYTQKVRIAVPESAGFSYSFALLISRQNNPQPSNGQRLLKGSVAVFTLVNIDRPGATRKIDVASFSIGKRTYEYLPAEFSLQLKNSGNSIVQPYGNIYIQRSSDDKEPIDVLPVNESKGYLLPNTSRTLNANWSNGFPFYETVTKEDGTTERKLVWNWSKLSNLRVGKYTAKLVAVYNDGERDVPLEGELTFWIVPWKLFGVLLVLLILLGFGLWTVSRYGIRAYRRLKGQKAGRFKAPSNK